MGRYNSTDKEEWSTTILHRAARKRGGTSFNEPLRSRIEKGDEGIIWMNNKINPPPPAPAAAARRLPNLFCPEFPRSPRQRETGRLDIGASGSVMSTTHGSCRRSRCFASSISKIIVESRQTCIYLDCNSLQQQKTWPFRGESLLLLTSIIL